MGVWMGAPGGKDVRFGEIVCITVDVQLTWVLMGRADRVDKPLPLLCSDPLELPAWPRSSLLAPCRAEGIPGNWDCPCGGRLT